MTKKAQVLWVLTTVLRTVNWSVSVGGCINRIIWSINSPDRDRTEVVMDWTKLMTFGQVGPLNLGILSDTTF